MPHVCHLPPAHNVRDAPYGLRTLKSPVLRGRLLRIFLWLVRTPIGAIVQSILRRKSGLPQALRETILPERPTYTPSALTEPIAFPDHITIDKRTDSDALAQVLAVISDAAPSQRSDPPSVRDYIEAYQTGRVTPLQVAEKIVSVIDAHPEFHWFISFQKEKVLEQARASTERYASNHPLSPLDGVPFCVKDTMHAQDHVTTCGTAHLNYIVDAINEQAPVVTSLKRLGGLFLGKTNMHEIGLGVTGLNLIHGTPVNPWKRDIYPGGSSSGGAAVVASGLCPLSVGSDGGGSIRIPSSFCGVVGLKPTHGREIPQRGRALDYTVCCYGPITNSVEDAMILYTILAKSETPVQLPQLTATEKPLEGFKFGVYWEWFNDASHDVKEQCQAMLDMLRDLGGAIVTVSIPELELLRIAHTTTISSEMRQAMNQYFSDRKIRRGMNLDIQMNLTIAENFRSQEYIQAQCIRTRMGMHFKKAMEKVDCLVTPTTPITAPDIHPVARRAGEHNLTRTSIIMRYMPAANFLGLPSMSIPVGCDAQGRPIGLQIMGKHWQESLLLKVGYHLEQKLKATAPRRTPEIYFNPLQASPTNAVDQGNHAEAAKN